MNFYRLLVLIVLFSIIQLTSSYGQRFRAGLVLGLNASQIQGDDLAGFDKLGLNIGLKSAIYLKDNMDLNVELLYSERGSRSDLFGNSTFQQTIKLQYIEIPVIYTLMDWLSDDEEYYRMHFHGGLSFGRLFQSSIEDEVGTFEAYMGQLNETDLSAVVGVTYYVNSTLGFGVRYNRSINKLYSRNPDSTINAEELFGYYLNFRVEYTIF